MSLDIKKNLLNKLYVKYNFHGKGIGKKLLNYAERYAKKRNIKYLKFYSTITAHEFYKSQGYKTIKRVNLESNEVKMPCIYMKKIL